MPKVVNAPKRVLLWLLIGLTCLNNYVPSTALAELAAGTDRIVEPVHFNVPRGYHDQPFILQLSTSTRGAVIRFTRDGSEPTLENGQVYAGPFTVSFTSVVRAAAFKKGWLPSTTETRSYLFNLADPLRGLPALSIVTASNHLWGPSGILGIRGGSYATDVWMPTAPSDYHNPSQTGPAWEQPVSVEFILTNDNSGFQIDAGLRVHGSDYTRARYRPGSQFSYRLYFRSDYGRAELAYPWFPDSSVDRFDVVVLRAVQPGVDNLSIRDELARGLHADMGQTASHGTFANLFVNGVYQGAYNPVERIDDHFLSHWHGGERDWDVITVGSQAQEGDPVAWNRLRSLMTQQDLTQPAAYQAIGRLLDLTNFVDYLLLNLYGATWDWPHNNWRAAARRTPAGLFRFYVWDAEGAFGHPSRPPGFNTFTAREGGLMGESEVAQFYRALHPNVEFRLLFADRIQKHFFGGGALTDSNVIARTDRLQQRMAGVAPLMERTIQESWVPQRRSPLFSQFEQQRLLSPVPAPEFSLPAGQVSRGQNLRLMTPVGEVYFTTDGSDPRVQLTGQLAAGATSYTQPIVLERGSRIKARTRYGRGWSALVEADFQIGWPPVPAVFTEINFHPPGGAAFQFLELFNPTHLSADLSGFRVEGIGFRFPEGTVLPAKTIFLLASDTDPAAFRSRYPLARVDGWFTRDLANSGERISLIDRSGVTVLSIDYDDESPWPTRPDGLGPSLELVDFENDFNSPGNWQASLDEGGSPGRIGPGRQPADVRLNELVAFDSSGWDGIELFNAGQQTMDLSGWTLRDDSGSGGFVFPQGTSLAAGGFLWVWAGEGTGNPPRGLRALFGLDRDGETLQLFNARSDRVDAVTFGDQIRGFSLGRFEWGWALAEPTPGWVNLHAALAPNGELRINEWMLAPLPGQEPWLELHNSSRLSPASLKGLGLRVGTHVLNLSSVAFVAPQGFIVLNDPFISTHLRASGGEFALIDQRGLLLDQVQYGSQQLGQSEGRFPDGVSAGQRVLDWATPKSPNRVRVNRGIVFNELMADNGSAADWIELHNPTGTELDLSQIHLCIDGKLVWRFPPGAGLPAGGYLVVWCDGTLPASYPLPRGLNSGESLPNEGGRVQLIDGAGVSLDEVAYGWQIRGQSIGDSAGTWSLLATPTPGAPNGERADLSWPSLLRINEWMARPARGPDWFEVYNGAVGPVGLSGLFITDDPAPVATTKFKVPPLSFVGPGGFVRWLCSAQPTGVGFDLNGGGEMLLLYDKDLTYIDSVSFGGQKIGFSQGRLPDGSVQIGPLSPSPAQANFTPPRGLRIEEIFPEGNPDWIELFNEQSISVDLRGWYFSDERSSLLKSRLDIVIPPRGFALLRGDQLGFDLNGPEGGEVFISQVDAEGQLTGSRLVAQYPATPPEKSVGLLLTAQGDCYVPRTEPTPGWSNAPPRVGPILLAEVMYHPPGSEEFEFVELLNLTTQSMALAGWQIRGGIRYDFGPEVLLPGKGRLLLVGFDPTGDPTQSERFHAHYQISTRATLVGPFLGRLDNGGDSITLAAPVTYNDGRTHPVIVERLAYQDAPPWPAGAVDGGGWSLQRRPDFAAAVDALAWMAGPPTAGRSNSQGLPLPEITSLSGDQAIEAGQTLRLEAEVRSGERFQWRHQGQEIAGADTPVLELDQFRAEDEGYYEVLVSNSAGSVLSARIHIKLAVPPKILSFSSGATLRAGERFELEVQTEGATPLFYSWYHDANWIAGVSGPVLLVPEVQPAHAGRYTVIVANQFGLVTSPKAVLRVLVPPSVVVAPRDQFVPVGGRAVFSVLTQGTLPIGYRWRRGGTTVAAEVLHSHTSFLVLSNVQPADAALYSVVLTNEAMPAPGLLSAPVALTIDLGSNLDGLPGPSGLGLTQVNLGEPEPVLQLGIAFLEAGARVEFNAEAGRTYTIEYADQLPARTWYKLSEIVARDQPGVVSVLDESSPGQRFYRLTRPRQP